MIPTRLAAWYLALQGVAVALWWSTLLAWPAFRAVFELGDRAVLQSFLLPDVGFGVVSLVAGRLVATGSRLAAPLAGVTVGAVGYSTAMTIGHVAAAGLGAVGAVAMTCATLGSAVSLHAVVRGQR